MRDRKQTGRMTTNKGRGTKNCRNKGRRDRPGEQRTNKIRIIFGGFVCLLFEQYPENMPARRVIGGVGGLQGSTGTGTEKRVYKDEFLPLQQVFIGRISCGAKKPGCRYPLLPRSEASLHCFPLERQACSYRTRWR